MENTNNNELFDLGSEDVNVDFDPFAEDEADTDAATETETEQSIEPIETPKAVPADTAVKKPDAKEPDPTGFADKPPVFEYAGATENIDDASKTFDELRIEKSADFPELEDGKRVSWTDQQHLLFEKNIF